MHAGLRSRRGFTLVESLAAFAILALVLGQLLAGVGGGVRNESRADFLLRAARQGASQLDALGVDGPPPFGETSGRYPDGLLWSLSVAPGRSVVGLAGRPIATSFHARLVIVRGTGYGDRFILSTAKVRAAQPEASRP
jgi:general secretion pathway protein I